MPWNGSGQFNRTDGTRTGATVWAQAKAAGVKIVTTGHDTHDEDLASGIEACWNRNGENALTADVSAGGFSITNLAGGAAAGEALAYGQDGALFISTDGGATAAPVLVLWRNSASPASDDLLGEVRFDGEDSAGNLQEYANIQAQIADAASTAESGRLLFSLMQSGTERIVFRLGINECRVTSWDAGAAAAPTLSLHRNSSSPADGDALAAIDFDGEDDGSTQTTFARIGAVMDDVTDTTEDGHFKVQAMRAGSLVTCTGPGVPQGSVSVSGTTVTFTIHGDAQRITVTFNAVSTDGSESIIVQLGDSGGVETTGYNGVTTTLNAGAQADTNHSTGFHISGTGAAAGSGYSGMLTFVHAGGNVWVVNGIITDSGDNTFQIVGVKQTSAVLDRIVITSTNAPDDFDGGAINVIVE